MPDHRTGIHTAQDKIIVLRTLESRIEEQGILYPLRKISPHCRDMADIVHAVQEIRIEIRFKMGFRRHISRQQLVLIGIDEAGIRVGMNDGRKLIQGIRR